MIGLTLRHFHNLSEVPPLDARGTKSLFQARKTAKDFHLSNVLFDDSLTFSKGTLITKVYLATH